MCRLRPQQAINRQSDKHTRHLRYDKHRSIVRPDAGEGIGQHARRGDGGVGEGCGGGEPIGGGDIGADGGGDTFDGMTREAEYEQQQAGRGDNLADELAEAATDMVAGSRDTFRRWNIFRGKGSRLRFSSTLMPGAR